MAFWRLRRLCRRWNQGSLYNSLTFSEEAYGFGGLLVTSLFQILDQCDLRTTTSALSRSGKMKSRQLRMTRSVLIIMHALINIVEEFHRQGVRRAVFRSLVFPRHHGGYNKRCNRLNKLLRKHARCEYYKPF